MPDVSHEHHRTLRMPLQGSPLLWWLQGDTTWLSTAPCGCTQTCCVCWDWWSHISSAVVRHMASPCLHSLHHSEQLWCGPGLAVEVYTAGRVTSGQFSPTGAAELQNSPKELGDSLGQPKWWADLAESRCVCICSHVPRDRLCIGHLQQQHSGGED